MKIEMDKEDLKRIIKLYFKKAVNIDVEVSIDSGITVRAPLTFGGEKYTCYEDINGEDLKNIFSFFDTEDELKSVKIKSHEVCRNPYDGGYKTITGVTVEIGKDLIKKRKLEKGEN